MSEEEDRMDQRQEALYKWVVSHIDGNVAIGPLVGGEGAGIRRYFHVRQGANTWVAVDAPPATEKLSEFVSLASILKTEGILVPDVIACDRSQGFILVTDFGNRTLLSVLHSNNVDRYYKTALETLIPIYQSKEARAVNSTRLGGALLRNELAQFSEWYLKRYCDIIIDPGLRKMLDKVFDALIENADAQEQVCCHRDYHSDNLMVLPDDRIGVIDFQDMMMGPITYDAVSLLRDCYVAWPDAQVDRWVGSFYSMLRESGFLEGVSLDLFTRWFDWMGMQRHIKATATFAAKVERDGDERYLEFIPTTLLYLQKVSARYPEFSDFHAFVKEMNRELV